MAMVLLVILSLVLIGVLWLRFDTLTAQMGQTQDHLRNQLFNYDALSAEMKLLQRRVALLERPVAAPSVHDTVSPTDSERVAEQTVLPEPPSLLIEREIPVEQIVVPTQESRTPPPSLPAPETPVAETVSQPSFASVTQFRDARNWEEMIGGNLLNKLGALVLVIGIALFLSYSLAHMGAFGRAFTGLGVSATMLAGGLWRERKGEYRMFARGVIAAGWASLYFTSYAMHALPATREIESPGFGLAFMLAVAAAMVFHSLRYRVQSLTSLAYGCIFAALALSDLTAFTVAALAPIAASLLYVGRRFRWYGLAVFGAASTYAVFLTRPATGAPLMTIESMLLLFWLMFEAFDLLRISAREPSEQVHDAFFALNALAGLGASAAIWYRMEPESMWQFCAASAMLYLISTVIRVLLGERSRYEVTLSLSALLCGLAIFSKVSGIWTSMALMLEAETLFLAGHYLRLRFARTLSLLGFAASLVLMPENSASTVVLGATIDNWAPPLTLLALLLYVNRWLAKEAFYFSYAASSFLALVLGMELPWRYVGTAWLGLGVLLFEFGWRKERLEFRAQAYALGILGVAGDAFGLLGPNYIRPLWVYAVGTILSFGAAVRATRFLRGLPEQEREGLRFGGAAGTAVLGGLFLSKLVPEAYWGLAWLGASVVLSELAYRRLPPEMGFSAGALNLVGLSAVLLEHANTIQKSPDVATWSSLAGAATAYYWLAARTARSEQPGRLLLRSLSSSVASALSLVTLWMVLPNLYVPVAFAALALVFVELGWMLRIPAFTLQGRILSLAAPSFLATMTLFGNSPTDLTGRAPNALLIASLHWYLWFRYRRDETAFLHGWLAAVVAATLVPLDYPDYKLALWSLLGCALASAAKQFGSRHLRWQVMLLAGVAAAFGIFGDAPFWQRCIVVAWFFLALLLEPRDEEGGWLRQGYSLAIALFAASSLFREVSGGMLTLSWGLEGIALLGAGFAVRERMLRLAGLALLLGCIGKLFAYDLRSLETFFRILSFIGLGLILLAVSWIYTRFKQQLRRFL
jgi:Predicted membrane protein (DUF2339)